VSSKKGLKKVLGTPALLLMGLGAILVQESLYVPVLPQLHYAGPGLVLSFIFAGENSEIIKALADQQGSE